MNIKELSQGDHLAQKKHRVKFVSTYLNRSGFPNE